MAIGESTLKI